MSPFRDTSNLAESYFKGSFQKKNIKEAVKWYSLSAKSGFELAQVNLAYLYQRGIGVRKNIVEALVWYQKAAKQGSQRAQIALSIMYQSGIDMDTSFKDAAFWYMQVIGANKKNDQDLENSFPYSVPQTNRDVALIYLEASRRGIISAQWGLGLLCNYGIGFDVHRLVPNRKLYLGGLKIKSKLGTLGHSDGDPVLHAITDSILGGCKLGDIGEKFSNKQNKFKNIRSTIFLKKVINEIRSKNYIINNLDINIITETPRIKKYKIKMIRLISKLCEISESQINIKGKTTEKLGIIGKEKAIACEVITSVIKNV